MIDKKSAIFEFLSFCKSDQTAKHYKNDLLKLCELFPSIKGKELTQNSQLEILSQELLSFDFKSSFYFFQNYKKELLTYSRLVRGVKQKGYSAATINRNLSSIKAFFRFSKRVGLIDFDLFVEFLPVNKYKDTEGPGKDALKIAINGLKYELKKASNDHTRLRLSRDLCIVYLAFYHGLRRSEIISIDFDEYDQQRGIIYFTQKRLTNELSNVKLPARVKHCLSRYIKLRGDISGPMFFRLDRKLKSNHALYSLNPSSINDIFKRLRDKYKLGRSFRPHGVRHTSITLVVEQARLNGGDPTLAQSHSRHADLNTLMIYDDNFKKRQVNGSKILTKLD